MNKNEFLIILRQSLEGSVDENILYNQLKYYENYINDELNKGNNEKDILNQLGDPRLLAKTIKQVNNTQDDTYSMNTDYYNEQYNGYNSSSNEYNEFNNKSNIPFFYSSNNLTIGCIIFILVLLIIMIALLQLFSKIIIGTFSLAVYSPFLFIFIVTLVFLLFRNRK